MNIKQNETRYIRRQRHDWQACVISSLLIASVFATYLMGA